MCGAELLILPESVQRVARVLHLFGHPHEPVMLDPSARTAQEAAAAHPHGVFQLRPDDLKQRTGAPAADVVVAP